MTIVMINMSSRTLLCECIQYVRMSIIRTQFWFPPKLSFFIYKNLEKKGWRIKEIQRDKKFGWQEQVEEGSTCINKRWKDKTRSLTFLETQ
jgi:hypothetical protein